MLGVNQSDFMSYMSAFKSNYRKGVHRMEAILANPTHAKEFSANLGGVSVVLGVPVDLPDRNSDKLLELLLGSDVADDAVLTWMHQFYEFTDWDDLLSDSARCKEMANNPLIWRAAGGSKLAVGKSVATLAGLSCSDYKDIDAVAASSVAMTAIQKSQTALNAIAASSMATAKYAAGAAGLNPADYADMAAVASSQVAMTAVAASQVAMAAVASSQVAMAAVIGNATALNAVVTSSVAMAAVAASQVAMAAVAASATARAAVCASDVAYNYLLSKATFDTISGQYTRSGWSTRYAKPCIVLKWCYSYNSGTSGIRTCLDGAASRQYTGTQRYNSSMGSNTYNDHAEKNGTYYKEFVFCSKLETYNSQSDWPAISIAYFPLP
ncbi:MAG: hypothetical protein Q3X70_06275 [Agathobaculum sp.]|nr:hypothetical protein [Agathobaculum sp.]